MLMHYAYVEIFFGMTKEAKILCSLRDLAHKNPRARNYLVEGISV